MKSPLAQDTAKSTKAMAQQIARQMAQEPLEVLKTAREQTFSPEAPRAEPQNQPTGPENPQPQQIGDKQELDNLKSSRRIEALNREIEDIQRQKLVNELQGKISAGESISLEEYPNLSLEQKQVLKAQMEAVRNQNFKSSQSQNALVEPASKPSRRFGPTRKQEAEKQQTRVEKPVPPSG
jgi:hypothetical protein